MPVFGIRGTFSIRRKGLFYFFCAFWDADPSGVDTPNQWMQKKGNVPSGF